MIKKLLIFAVPIIVIVVVFSLNTETNNTYRESIADIRAEKLRFLKYSEASPFNQLDVKFQPIEYFPIDPTFKVKARIEWISPQENISVENSDGTFSNYRKFAFAHFELKEQPLKLLILKPTGFGTPPNVFFTGFADETSGVDSYGGGRYLDLEIKESEYVTIDFNLAYNPYCAYTHGYTCPLPPKENILPIKITAGEKDYNY